MPGDETRTKHTGEESESEDESDVEPVVKVEIDPSKLTPLSPEVISKQVRMRGCSPLHAVGGCSCRACLAGYD